MNKHERSAAILICKALKHNLILTAYDALSNCDRTCGPYIEAVDRGIRFAVLSHGRNASRTTERFVKTAEEAAESFVLSVGSTRAREAAKYVFKKITNMSYL